MVNRGVEVGEHIALDGAQLGCKTGEARLQHSERVRHGVLGGLARRLQEDLRHRPSTAGACTLGTTPATLCRKRTLQRCQVAPVNT